MGMYENFHDADGLITNILLINLRGLLKRKRYIDYIVSIFFF